METAASFEVRNAPSSYPTIGHHRDADAVRVAEGSIQTTDSARLRWGRRSPEPGACFQEDFP
jgi:hypothetical protein